MTLRAAHLFPQKEMEKRGNKSAAVTVYSGSAPSRAYVRMTAIAFRDHPRAVTSGKAAMDPARKLAQFEQTVIPHLNAAYNLARWLAGNSEDAQDLVQEAYLRAFRFFDTFQGQDARAWLLAVVRNTCFTWLRKRGDQRSVEFDEQLHGPEETADAETLLLNQAALGLLNDCLEALPVEFRETIVLRELEELSYKEISNITRVPVGTVMSRLARARKRLQQCLTGALR